MSVLNRSENRIRRVISDHRFENLADRDAPARLTKIIGSLAEAISENREIAEAPGLVNLAAVSLPGAVYLSWDDVPRENVKSIDGARIWRAKASDDPEENFYANSAKTVLVGVIRATAFIDIPPNTDLFVYFAEWVNMDGRTGRAGGGVTIAAT